MSGAHTMESLADAYLAERRRLGFALHRSGSLTLTFARYADMIGHEGPLTAALVLQWAKEEAQHAAPFTWAGRVAVLGPFARFLADREPATEFPTGSPFGSSHRRIAPHIYTPSEVKALVAAAGRLSPQGGLTPATFTTLFGLLAATGLRISEALHLRCGDLDQAQACLTVRHSKFDRSRLVPLHPTAIQAVGDYLPVRGKYGPMDAGAPLFLSEKTGHALTYPSVKSVFDQLSVELAIHARGGHRVICIHDLRHTFICRRVILWQESGIDLGNAMMALSTYVGHVSVAETYWYVQAVPELMAIAGDRFEALGAKLREVRHG
jgi:integrase/recombinase XerD